MRIYKVFGRKCRAHVGCIEGFREDRRHGLIYGQYKIIDADGRYELMGVEAASIAGDFCCYCGVA